MAIHIGLCPFCLGKCSAKNFNDGKAVSSASSTFSLPVASSCLALITSMGAPLLPIISQNYGIWQTVYIASLVVLFLLWTMAMRQRLGLLENSKQGLRLQLRIDEQQDRRR